MKLTLLGTGTPVPSLKRMSSGYLLCTGDDVILFDHGPGAHHRLLEAEFSATDVTHAFISHLHFDHCADMIRLFLNRWDMGGDMVAPMKIFGPPGLQQFMDRQFGPEGAFAPDLTARIEHPMSQEMYESRGGTLPRPWPVTAVTELRESDVVEGDGWRLTLANVPHVQPYLTCYGFRFEATDGVFSYSGDSAPCKAMHELARDADVLVHICSRASVEDADPSKPADRTGHKELARLARDAGVKTLVVSHIQATLDREDIRERLIAEMGEIFEGTLIWGQDLVEIDIGEG
jgi:ribonuclease BN (tRNA processing enzyme)